LIVSSKSLPAAPPVPEARFQDLGLSEPMLAALAAAEYLNPTPIQAGLIPRALTGVDVLGQARTGTGKTAAFVIPILERVEPHKRGTGPQALVLVPTRELAVQVREEVVKLAHGKKIHSVALYGGKPIRGQIEKLQRGAEVVIGTPGRVLDHLSRGTLILNDLKIAVLDEADRMLDIGFRPDIEKILRRCPKHRQTLLLSATVPPPVEKLARSYMHEPESLNFSPKDISVDTIEQFFVTVEPDRKFEALERMVAEHQPQQAIVFCRTKRGTDKVYRKLSKRYGDVEAIHGDLGQGARDRVMAAFRGGKVRILVATDVVGRGIDVSGISHIYNYDIPAFCDDYVHRVGRTGRMGREGVAYTLVTPEEGNELTRIEIRINKMLTKYEVPGFKSLQVAPAVLAAEAPAPAPNRYIQSFAAPKAAPPAQAPPKSKKYRRAL
jgi:ATP-dependent RNA helicase DeaD